MQEGIIIPEQCSEQEIESRCDLELVAGRGSCVGETGGGVLRGSTSS